MFLDSVIAGIDVFDYWETYAATLGYLAVFCIPMAIIGATMERSEGGSAAFGCFSMILLPLLQVTAITLFVLTLAPIILGFSDDAAWGLPWKMLVMTPGTLLELIGVLVIVALVLAFFPILGRFNSLQTIVLGGIALVFVLGLLGPVKPGIAMERIDFIPDLGCIVGLLLIGGLMSLVGLLVSDLVAAGLGFAEEGLGQLLMFPVSAFFGFIPLFVYGAWLGAQIKNGV